MAKKQTVSGFALGTLVHTKEGLKPIETIKVGDLVLSKPENGEGEQAYKHVLRTFAHPPERVIKVRYIPDENQKIAHNITTTLNHPFWVTGEGWTAAENLHDYWTAERKLELCDGRQVKAYGTGSIYVSEQPGVGWLPNYDGRTEYPGDLWDYVNHRLVATKVPAMEAIQDGEHPDPFLQLPVYNLEVEDFHTYYVGKHSVWVHE